MHILARFVNKVSENVLLMATSSFGGPMRCCVSVPSVMLFVDLSLFKHLISVI
jgi:hypothetical protein